MMCWCRIELVLIGLLGLLCVVHVIGMCGQDFPSTAQQSDVVIQGKVLNVSRADRASGLYYAKIKVRKPILKGTKIIKKAGKAGSVLTLGPFRKRPDVKNCFGPVRKGKTYIFALNQRSKSSGVSSILQALPRRKNKKEFKLLKDTLCKFEKTCKKAKPSPPKIKKISGPKNTRKVGSKLTFKCFAKAKPNPKYKWYKDGVELTPAKGRTISNRKRYSKLQIKGAQMTDEGIYRCEAINPRGTDTKDFDVFYIRSNPKPHRNDDLCVTQTLCLNGGTCLFNKKLDIPYCVCNPNWTGTRCEIMDSIRIHGHYSRQATLLYERTLIIVGLAIAVLVFIAICIVSYFLAKRKRKKFEARKKRKQERRAQNSVRMKDNATQSFYKPDESLPLHNAYQPVTQDTRGFFPGHDNGFNFEAAQRQPLLRHHGADDVDGGSGRRRLVASSMYDNFDELPNTASPNRNANVTGLTTAEVTQNPEMIEMSPMENRVADHATNAAATPDERNNIRHHPRAPNPGEESPYPPPPPLSHENSTSPLTKPSSPDSPLYINNQPLSTSSPNEIHHPLSDHQLPPPPSPTEEENLDFEKYTAPPPPILPLSHSNSSPLRNTPAPNSSAPVPASDGSSPRFPTSNSMPIRLYNSDDNDNDNIINNGDPSNNHSSLPHNHNSNFNPYANVPPSNNESPMQSLLHPLSRTPSEPSLPSYDTAINVFTNGIGSDDIDNDVDDSDDGVDSQFGNNPSSTVEDLHISEEDDLGLSAENLPRGSFNSSAYPSRQPSVDTEGPSEYNDMFNRRRRFSAEKQQSEDILQPEPFWKRSMLCGQSPRSQSLDMPSSDRVNGTGLNHLDSTVSGNQNILKQDGHLKKNTGNYNHHPHHHHHHDDVFDPNDDSTPWDPERQQQHQQQQQQSCNSNYQNLMDGERDRLNRLKDVCPDQPAIPI